MRSQCVTVIGSLRAEGARRQACCEHACTAHSFLTAPACLLPALQVDLKHDLNARDYLGRTPLHYAAMHGRVGVGGEGSGVEGRGEALMAGMASLGI